MKIAIFHNLNEGGGLVYVSKIVEDLTILNIKVDVYTHQTKQILFTDKTYSYPLQNTTNIFSYIYKVLFDTTTIEKQISTKIIKNKYNYVLVFPCNLQQCPNLIKYLPKNNTYYFYLENLREFYEKTSFDYYTPLKIISRIIRTPIKIQDYLNCKFAKNIIVDSFYSRYQLLKIYNKNSYVIHPGMTRSSSTKHIIKNNKKSLSFGLLSMLKGHHLSAKINPKIKIYGAKSHEIIKNYINKNTYINRKTISNNFRDNLFKNHTFYFANQINEPFGIVTLEATTHNAFVIGRNEAGTSEIINNGNNGLIYNINNIKLAKRMFKLINKKNKIKIYSNTKIDWGETVDKILYIIKYV